MREFLVHGHDVALSDSISLDDLPGAGRLDLLARCVTAGLLLSHGVREDSRVSVVLSDEYTITFDGGSIRGLHPDERSTAARIREGIERQEEAIGHLPVELSQGIALKRQDFAAVVRDCAEQRPVYQLHPDGQPLWELSVPEEAGFVLSDHREFSSEDESVLTEVRDGRVSVGPRALQADHVITIVHNWLDTDGFSAV